MADPAAIIGLHRVTTTYDPTQDRVLLGGELDDGAVLRLWVTRRMLERLVPELCRWLEESDVAAEMPRGEVLQSFKQQSAASRLEPSGPVDASEASGEWLVTSIDVQRRSKALRLVFRAPDQHEERIGLSLSPLQLRQWLQIVLTAYRRGEWPLDIWPEWMRDQLGDDRPASVSLH